MARHASRVRETSTTTGTGTLSLAGAVGGFRTFVAGVGTGKPARYTIRNRDVPSEWEAGVGIVTDATPDTLTRAVIIASSNSDAVVNFSAGTKDVFCSVGGDDMSRLDQLPLRVKVASTANLTLSGTQTIDGVSAGVGDRVLAKDQSTASQNGIYKVASGSWTRVADLYTGDAASCCLVLVDQGTVSANTVWFCTTNSGSDVVGTDSLTFTLLSTAGTIGATKGGTGLSSYTLGDLLYSSATDTLAKLAGNTTTTAKALLQTGNGSVSAAPAWTAVPTSITGTANQVVASASTGAITLSLPQSIATTSSVQFAMLGVGYPVVSTWGVAALPTLAGAGTHYGMFCGPTSTTDTPSIFAGGVYQCVTQVTGSAKTYPDVRGAWAASTTKTQAGDTITVNTGVYVSDQTAGATNYGLYTNAGNNYLGDDLMIGTTTAPSTNSGKSLMFGASAGNVTPGASTCGLFGKTVTQVEVFAVDSAANVTQLSPHPDKVMDGHADLCKELGIEPARIPWGYESEQALAGVVTRVDLAAVVRLVEMLASERLGRPVNLLIEETVAPSMDWDAREAAADEQHIAQVESHERLLAAFREQVAQREALPPLLRSQTQRPLFAGARRPIRHRTEKPKYLRG